MSLVSKTSSKLKMFLRKKAITRLPIDLALRVRLIQELFQGQGSFLVKTSE